MGGWIVRNHQREIDAARDEAARRAEEEAKRRVEAEAGLDEFVGKWNASDGAGAGFEGMQAMRFDKWRRRIVALELELNAKGESLDMLFDDGDGVFGFSVDVGWKIGNRMSPVKGLPGKMVEWPPFVEGFIEVDFGGRPGRKTDNEARLLVARRTGMISNYPPDSPILEWKFSYRTIDPDDWKGMDPAAIIVADEWAEERPGSPQEE